MIEVAGLVLAIVDIAFAFETPRSKFLTMLGWRTSASSAATSQGPTVRAAGDLGA